MLDSTDPDAYTIGWMCALPEESVAAQEILDEEFNGVYAPDSRDTNSYQYGRIKHQYVVIAVLPKGGYGTVNAGTAATNLLRSFPNVRVGLMVGIGGGVPSPKHDIRLGDVVVGTPQGEQTGVLQYDFGKAIQGEGFKLRGSLNSPPQALLTAVSNLQTIHERQGNGLKQGVERVLERNPRLNKSFGRPDSDTDILFEADLVHRGDSCNSCLQMPGKVKNRIQRTDMDNDLIVHYGTIASGDKLMRDAIIRDRLASDKDVLCFEMEAAGLMNSFPCLVIRGICDYSDSHKTKTWQGYAALAAAAYAKQIICLLSPRSLQGQDPLKEQLAKVSSQVTETNRCIQAIHDYKADIDVLEWLSDINVGAHHDDAFSRRVPDTGRWLVESVVYRDWMDSKGRVLFCPGIPGAGKTILTSIVVNDLTEQFQDSTDTAIAYIYCSFKRQNTQQIVRLLTSLLKQLCHHLPSVPKTIRELYETHFRKRTRPQLHQTREALEVVVRSYSKVFILVDGLDEWSMSENDQSDLVDELLRLHARTSINLFATSRYVPEILGRFSQHPSFQISSHQDDIRLYIEHNLWRISRYVTIDKDLEHQIKATICETSIGMFLLAKFYLDSLTAQTSVADLKTTLDSFRHRLKQKDQANVLTAMYDEAMQRVLAQKERSSLAIQVLTWICYTDQELSIKDLQFGLSLHDGMTEFSDENIIEVKQLISVCCGLVVVDEASDRIRLAHFTAQDYFNVNQRRWFPNAHAYLAMQCLHYLLLPNSLRPHDKEASISDSDDVFDVILWIMKRPLRGYAMTNWGRHAKLAETEMDGSKEMEDRMKKIDNAAFQVLAQQPDFSSVILFLTVHHSDLWDWQWEWSNNLNYPVRFQLPTPRSDANKWDISANGLHLAGYWGLTRVLPLLLPKFGIDSRDKFGQTALCWASKGGQIDAVKFLLRERNRGDQSSRESDQKIALLQAISGDHVAIVRLLLDIKDDPSLGDQISSKLFQALSLIFPNGPGFTSLGDCLVEACQKGNLDIIRPLIDKHPSLNFTDSNSSTPLIEAAKRAPPETVEFLLDHGACPNFRNNRGFTALMEASGQGRVDIARLLLERGARLNVETPSGRTALMRASYRDEEDVAKLLVARGADINVKDFMGRTSLMEACAAGSEGIAKLLVQEGADVNAKDKKGRSCLIEASQSGSGSIATLLIWNGASLTVEDEDCNTPLLIASRGGYSVIVSLLLENGATDLTSHAEALWEASSGGHRETVKVLLTHPTASLLCGIHLDRHPLLAAVEAGDNVVVDMLLNVGFDIETKSKDGETPLILAARTGREEIVQRLINRGANVHSLDKSGLSAFLYANRNKHGRIVKIFRDMGINYQSYLEVLRNTHT